MAAASLFGLISAILTMRQHGDVMRCPLVFVFFFSFQIQRHLKLMEKQEIQ